MKFRLLSLLIIMGLASLGSQLMAQDAEPLTIYSGRSESLIGPVLDMFTEASGIEVQVVYGDTAAIANQIFEEGKNSPADVYIAQDAGALGLLSKNELLEVLPEETLELVSNPAFVSPIGEWTGLSGRARVLVYNPETLEALGLELPESILDLTDEIWRDQVGWAPTNASFQANVSAMRLLIGEDETLAWLEGMVNNGVRAYEKNTPVVQAVINGEVAVGLVNHYYLYRFLAEDPELTTSLYYFPAGDPGALINVAGAAILKTSDQKEDALTLINYLLSEEAQTYFAEETYEYPLIEGVEPSFDLVLLEEIEMPDLDLSDLDDLRGTLELIEESGALDY
ncbi:iron ABC transporter substrate-binding protein [Anaerolineales bacterium]